MQILSTNLQKFSFSTPDLSETKTEVFKMKIRKIVSDLLIMLNLGAAFLACFKIDTDPGSFVPFIFWEVLFCLLSVLSMLWRSKLQEIEENKRFTKNRYR